MSRGNQTDEQPTPLGDRVYTKHRKMLAKLRKKLGVSRAEVVRRAIEEAYGKYFGTA